MCVCSASSISSSSALTLICSGGFGQWFFLLLHRLLSHCEHFEPQRLFFAIFLFTSRYKLRKYKVHQVKTKLLVLCLTEKSDNEFNKIQRATTTATKNKYIQQHKHRHHHHHRHQHQEAAIATSNPIAASHHTRFNALHIKIKQVCMYKIYILFFLLYKNRFFSALVVCERFSYQMFELVSWALFLWRAVLPVLRWNMP